MAENFSLRTQNIRGGNFRFSPKSARRNVFSAIFPIFAKFTVKSDISRHALRKSGSSFSAVTFFPVFFLFLRAEKDPFRGNLSEENDKMTKKAGASLEALFSFYKAFFPQNAGRFSRRAGNKPLPAFGQVLKRGLSFYFGHDKINLSGGEKRKIFDLPAEQHFGADLQTRSLPKRKNPKP